MTIPSRLHITPMEGNQVLIEIILSKTFSTINPGLCLNCLKNVVFTPFKVYQTNIYTGYIVIHLAWLPFLDSGIRSQNKFFNLLG
jgi:hypothetical protein